MINMHQRKNLQLLVITTFVSSILVLSFHSLSLILSCTLREFLQHYRIHLDLEKVGKGQEKEIVDNGREGWINKHNKDTLQVTSCMCDFLASFWMHFTCIWFYGYVFSLAWIFSYIESDFILSFQFLGQPWCSGIPFFYYYCFSGSL